MTQVMVNERSTDGVYQYMSDPDAFRLDPRWAYLEWLHYEARLLRIELEPNTNPDSEFSPCGTFAKRFHFPADRQWTDVPKPSTRALQVMVAAGVEIPEGIAN